MWLLDFGITCNHVHLMLDAEKRLEVSGFMQEVASEFARVAGIPRDNGSAATVSINRSGTLVLEAGDE